MSGTSVGETLDWEWHGGNTERGKLNLAPGRIIVFKMVKINVNKYISILCKAS